MLSLTSPKLVKGGKMRVSNHYLMLIHEVVSVSVLCSFVSGMAGGKYRSFLVHIKAVSDKGMDESPRPVMRMPSAKPQGTKAHSLSTLLQRAQASKVQIQSIVMLAGLFKATPQKQNVHVLSEKCQTYCKWCQLAHIPAL